MRVSFISTAAASFSAPSDTGADLLATVASVAPAKLPKAPRKPRAVKLAARAAEPVTEAAPAPVADVPAVTAEPAAETPRVAPIMRTCATIARNATNFGGTLSDRDHAYIAFFASFAKASDTGVVTVRAIVDSGRAPAYGGSAKPHDAGVVNRLRKAGLLTVDSDGTSFAFTPAALTLKSYTAA